MKMFLVFNEMDQIKVNRVGGEVVNLIFFFIFNGVCDCLLKEFTERSKKIFLNKSFW